VKFASLLQRLVYRDPTALPAFDILKIGTLDAGWRLGSNSSLDQSKKAREPMLSRSTFKASPHSNYDSFASLVYPACDSNVDTFTIDGKIFMENKRLATLNEQALIERAY
jgi:5-methylthioadenosine/S-adenosylhomocysteine deaminase